MSSQPAHPEPHSPDPQADPATDPCKSIFLTLAEADPAARRAELGRLARSDPALHTRVAALLAAHDRAATPLDAPPSWTWTSAGTTATDTPGATNIDPCELNPHDLDAPVRPGDQLGPYTVVSSLGSGAMGLVFAARHAGTNRVVALKLIRPDASSPAARRRFETEGRALARLRHPGIAQVHDAGVAHHQGQPLPYLAMELVDGRFITDAARDMPRPDRVRLIERIARAVHHAHLNGVVHRDLKPANILIDANGDPKVLDFGVAKLTAADAPAMTTHAGQLIGTPAYMSPEQLGADPAAVDHRADVYALGVLLFELLAGRRPIESAPGEDLWSVLRRVEQGPPPLASVDPVSRGDLTVITAVALRKDPADRYQSAAELADDLARHLASQPIHARPRTRRYVLGRFVKRNPLPIALGAAAALAVMAGTTGILLKQREARAAEARAVTRFNETRGLARTVLFDLSDAIERLPGSTPARRVLAQTAQSYLDRLADDPAADDDLLIELGEAYTRLGDMLGLPYDDNLGDLEGARRNWQRALEILGPLTERVPDDPRVLAAASRAVHSDNAYSLPPRTAEQKLVNAERSFDLALRAASLAPDDPQVASRLIESMYRVALEHHAIGRTRACMEWFATATDAAQERLARWPEHRDVRRIATDAIFWRGYIMVENDQPEAQAWIDRAADLCLQTLDADPTNTAALQRLATVHTRSALLAARSGEAQRVADDCAAAAEITRRMAAADPENQYLTRSHSVTIAMAGMAFRTLADADPDHAAEHLHTALQHLQEADALLKARIDRGWLWPWESQYPEIIRVRIETTESTIQRLHQAAEIDEAPTPTSSGHASSH